VFEEVRFVAGIDLERVLVVEVVWVQPLAHVVQCDTWT